MTHTRITPVAGLQADEIVRIDGGVVKVVDVTTGRLVYRGAEFEIAYVSGQTAEGPFKGARLASEIVIAGR